MGDEAMITANPALIGLVAAIGNVALDLPAGTITEVGTVKYGELELSSTTMPPGVAGTSTITWPIRACPAPTDPEDVVTLRTRIGRTVRVPVRFKPSRDALMITGVLTLTGPVRIAKVTERAPAGTLTAAGTDATEGFALTSPTVTPPAPRREL